MNQKLLQDYEKELLKNKNELDNEKKQFIRQIKKFDKDEIKNYTQEKITIWQRIRKTLGF